MREPNIQQPPLPRTSWSNREGQVYYTRLLDSSDGVGIKGELVLSNLDWVCDDDFIDLAKPKWIINCAGPENRASDAVLEYQSRCREKGIECFDFCPAHFPSIRNLKRCNHVLKRMWQHLQSDPEFLVIVHCISGQTRSPAAVACVLLLYTTWPVDQIFSLLARHRSHPNPWELCGWENIAKQFDDVRTKMHYNPPKILDDPPGTRPRWQLRSMFVTPNYWYQRQAPPTHPPENLHEKHKRPWRKGKVEKDPPEEDPQNGAEQGCAKSSSDTIAQRPIGGTDSRERVSNADERELIVLAAQAIQTQTQQMHTLLQFYSKHRPRKLSPRPQFRGTGNWPAKAEDRLPGCRWLARKKERAATHHLTVKRYGRAADWQPTAVVRGTGCAECTKNDRASFCVWDLCAKCCVDKYGGCWRSTHRPKFETG